MYYDNNFSLHINHIYCKKKKHLNHRQCVNIAHVNSANKGFIIVKGENFSYIETENRKSKKFTNRGFKVIR